MRCRFDAEAVADVERINDWYDRQATGLGTRFADELGRVISWVCRFPNAYASVHKSVRRAGVGRFPYFVAYEDFVGEIVVLGGFAEAQHPSGLIVRTGKA